jgi:hypothetical protein
MLLVLTTAALLAAMVAASATSAVADIDGSDDSGISEENDNDSSTFEDEDEDDGIDDVAVGDAFIDGDDICVPVVITYEDGSTSEDEECAGAEDASFDESTIS